MGEEAEQPFENLLGLYDGQRKDDADARRMAVKPLYDFFRRLLDFVGANLCHLPERTLKASSVNTLWEQVKPSLAIVDNSYSRWDELISNIQHVRNKDHDLDHDPPLGNLETLRKAAPEFRTWILDTGRKVLMESPGVSLKERYYRTLDYYVSTAKQLLEQYGAEDGYLYPAISDDRDLMAGAEAHLKAKKLESAGDASIEFTDLQDLLTVGEIVGRLQGLESFLLKREVCPKCGGKIKETQHGIGGGYDEPPSVVQLRVGCQNCDFELFSETINV